MQTAALRYSFIVPLYDRPEGLQRLMDSLLTHSSKQAYELVVVEDASSSTAEEVVRAYSTRLRIKYITLSKNSGPAAARNAGCSRAEGKYLLFVDSDTAIERDYFTALEKALSEDVLVFAGGVESLPPDSSSWQKAIHYSMCAWLSTGGIRSSRLAMERFKPRTHNMIVRRDIFQEVGGFNPQLRYGEDIDFSLRMEKAGYRGRLFVDLKVLHYRKANLHTFFQQVYQSGCARVRISQLHPGSTKLVHLLPAVFVVAGITSSIVVLMGWKWPVIGFLMYVAVLFAELLYRSANLLLSAQAVLVAFVQLTGYGIGYLQAKLRIQKTPPKQSASST